MPNDQADTMADVVSLTTDPVDADLWGKVTKQTPNDDPGFAVSIGRPCHDDAPDGVRMSVVVEPVVERFEDRYDVTSFDDGTPVGVVLFDAVADEALPVGLYDTVGFEHDDTPDDAAGMVAVIGHSGDLRVRGVGTVDVEPCEVIEVVDEYDGDE